MARKTRRQTEERGPQPAAWLVTFSDCMTLLLCFFVMLMSFSSFDKAAKDRVAGAFRYPPRSELGEHERTIEDSLVRARPQRIDHTKEGSEMPTDDPFKDIKNPRRPEDILDADAYRDKQVLFIPSSRLFWAQGISFAPRGRDRLRLIASFARVLPCQLIVGEVPTLAEARMAPDAATERGLNRAWAVMQFLVRQGVAESRFHLSAGQSPVPARFAREPVMEITLLADRVCE